MKSFLLYFTLTGIVLACTTCKTTQKQPPVANPVIPFSAEQIVKPGPPVIIYKTNGEYFDKVPVIFSDDRNSITSYPAFTDLIKDGDFTYPTELANGYLLDNRGISPTVAFLKYSYKEYYELGRTLTMREMMGSILDPAPIKEMYRCRIPHETDDRVSYINELIVNGMLQQCERIK